MYYFIIISCRHCKRVVRTRLQCFRRKRHWGGACSSLKWSKTDIRHVPWCTDMSSTSLCSACILTVSGEDPVNGFKFFLSFLSLPPPGTTLRSLRFANVLFWFLVFGFLFYYCFFQKFLICCNCALQLKMII